MAKASALVVSGHVDGRSQDVADGLLFTDFSFRVSRGYRGDARDGQDIVVRQTGGIQADGIAVEMRDDPLFAEGVEYLLFLKQDPATGKYFVAGGPDGRFVIRNGLIVTLSDTYKDRHIIDTKLRGIRLADVPAQVQ